ncbi:hypothetical protein BDP27DRAFT_1194443, partial [Rhodocollybia butyracea]
NEDEDNNIGDPAAHSAIENICITDEFIQLLRDATLDNDGLDAHTLYQLRNPVAAAPDDLDSHQRLSINLYLSITHASEATYHSVRDAIHCCFPESNILSYHEVKNLIADITGVVAIYNDMCINSCHAYTGPFKDLDKCKYCQEPRYDQNWLLQYQERIPRQQFSTILLGPQLAAI